MPPRVDFYLTEEAGLDARLRLACRLAEKAYLSRQRVIVLLDGAETLQKLDELLWTFADGSFVPHEIVGAPEAPRAAGTEAASAMPAEMPAAMPVVLTTGAQPTGALDVLINLGQQVPPCFEKFARVAEILDSRPEVRGHGRERFKAYRAKGIEPQTHNL